MNTLSFKDKIFSKYDDLVLIENKAEEHILRSKIKSMLKEYTEKDSDCYHLLGLVDYESDDWKKHIEQSISNFKKAIELDKGNFLAQLYLAHCYHDLNQLDLALENYKKVDQKKLKEFQVWRYTKLIEQIGYCEYKLGNEKGGEKHFEKVLKWYKKLPEIDRVTPSELIECLPKKHRIVIEMKKIIFILALLFIPMIGFSQTDSIRGNQFDLKGKIINQVSLTPHCGIIAWGTVIEFEIIKFSDSTYKRNSIGIIFTCPELYGDAFFETGKTYDIIVADENQADFGWTIPNESILAKYNLSKKLWAIKADKIIKK